MTEYAVRRGRGGRARTPLEWIEEFAVPEPNSGCWLWTGAMNPVTGYGSVTVTFPRPASPLGTSSHRLAYMVYREPIPEGLHIDHLCRNRLCCNPDHLEAVTQRENNRRAPNNPFMINAAKTHCKNGHEFTPENTYLAPNAKGRACLACTREYGRLYKKANIEKVREQARLRAQVGTPTRHSLEPLPDGDSRHGTSSAYGYWRCRCEVCRSFKSAENLAKRARKAGAK